MTYGINALLEKRVLSVKILRKFSVTNWQSIWRTETLIPPQMASYRYLLTPPETRG